MKKLLIAIWSLILAPNFVDAAPPKDLRAVAIKAPPPEYPYEARRAHIVGRGVAVMEVDPTTGKVTHAYMAPSTGSRLLDDASLSAFRQWQFKPGTVSKVVTPINYTMLGGVITTVHVEAKPMDKMLAPFLGKGTVVKGPMPQYPRSVPWTEKYGEGLYELHVDKNGDAAKARVLKSSGDTVFDQTTVTTLKNWRLRRGP